jgi:hypothetical protein
VLERGQQKSSSIITRNLKEEAHNIPVVYKTYPTVKSLGKKEQI